jgi:hypothetical protein
MRCFISRFLSVILTLYLLEQSFLHTTIPQHGELSAADVVSKASENKSSEKLVFNRDIRPILAENCFFCHGADKAKREADLRLDERAIAIEMKSIIPGNAAESLIIQRIFETDPDTVMPPPKSHKTLTNSQQESLKRWVSEGAEYQPHWAFIAPEKPVLPTVKNQAWVVNPLDAFVLKRLENLNPIRQNQAQKIFPCCFLTFHHFLRSRAL